MRCDHRRRSNRVDVGGELALAGRRRCHCRAGAPARISLARAQAVALTHHQVSINVESRSVPLAGQVHPFVHFPLPLDISDFPTRHNYVLGLCRTTSSASWPSGRRVGVTIYRGRERDGFAHGRHRRRRRAVRRSVAPAEYLVGCDGGPQSYSQGQPASKFPGWGSDDELADRRAEMAGAKVGISPGCAPHPRDRRRWRMAGRPVVRANRSYDSTVNPPLRDVSERSSPIYGTDYRKSTVPPGSPASPT